MREVTIAAEDPRMLGKVVAADRVDRLVVEADRLRQALDVVQKSLAEGFGLTVAEAMYKHRAVIGSAVGGIADQIVDGESGLLLADPTDRGGFAALVGGLIGDPERRRTIGRRAHERVVDRFLPDSQLAGWAAVVTSVLTGVHDA